MKFKKKGIIALSAALCVALFASAAMAAYDDPTLRSEIADGGTVILEKDITIDEGEGAIIVTNNVILDLNGKTLTRKSESSNEVTYIFRVREGAILTINDSAVGGTMTSSNPGNQNGRCLEIGDGNTGGTVIMNGGTLIGDYREPVGNSYGGQAVRLQGNTSYTDREKSVEAVFTMRGGKIQAGMAGVTAYGMTSTVNIENGEIESLFYGITGNGTNSPEEGKGNFGGTVINISGGTVKSEQSCAIYQPQAGTITITGGIVTGYDGIQIKSGTLTMTGGILEGTGPFGNTFTYPQGQNDGYYCTGAALSIVSHGKVANVGYAGNMSINISGDAELRSANGHAIVEANMKTPETQSKFTSLSIAGGTFTGADGEDVISMTNVKTDENGNSNTNITGGTFSSDPRECNGMGNATIAEGTIDENGKYVISSPETEPSTPQHSGGGGGCSAGFGALALLAAVPLLRMRKK